MDRMDELATLIFSELEAGNYTGSKIECIEGILRRGELRWSTDKPEG